MHGVKALKWAINSKATHQIYRSVYRDPRYTEKTRDMLRRPEIYREDPRYAEKTRDVPRRLEIYREDPRHTEKTRDIPRRPEIYRQDPKYTEKTGEPNTKRLRGTSGKSKYINFVVLPFVAHTVLLSLILDSSPSSWIHFLQISFAHVAPKASLFRN